MKYEKLVVFYDGECGFCNKSIQFILRNEQNNELYFTSLQSNYTRKFLEDNGFPPTDLSTLYFYSNGKLFSKSSAVLQIIPSLKWYFQPLRIGYILPKFLRDYCYDWVAKRRQKIASGFCAIPSADELKRFLD